MLLTKDILPKTIFILFILLCKRIDILLVCNQGQTAVGFFLRGVASKFANWYLRAQGCSVVDIHIFGFVDCTVGSLILASVAHVLIECPLAVGSTVCSGCGLSGLLLLDLLVGLGFGNDVCEEFEVLHTSDCVGCGIFSIRLEVGETTNTHRRHDIGCSCGACALT
jgi:hypothetical protein